jgi:ATP-binding cassette subfamily C protein EexD
MQKVIKNALKDALGACKSSFLTVGFFSMFINLLMIVPAIYMLQVYDRVVTSGSITTLVMLTLIMTLLLVSMGCLEWVRSRILIRVGNKLDRLLSRKVFDNSFKIALYSGGKQDGGMPINDLTGLRQFMTGNGLFAFFDAPWVPIYLGVMFVFHPWYGWIGVGSAIVLVILALCNEKMTSKILLNANQEMSVANARMRKNLANAEVVESMGMLGRMRDSWQEKQTSVLYWQTKASERAAVLTNLSKTIRMLMQSLILGVGAYLVVQQEITPGLMIAGSILLGRALAPVDQMIGVWKGFVGARGQYQRLSEMLANMPVDPDTMSLPAPKGQIQFEGVMVAPPGSRNMTLKNITFAVPAGQTVGILGPSASGKSTLARALLGIWPVAAGKVRLDGADIFSWNREELGSHIGYLPQDIELFEGTISENIARFGEIDAEEVVAAAVAAGVHQLILNLPNGYDTAIAAQGGGLSGGQRQRIGLARALYGRPSLIVLDEPNSNLDEVGEQALALALKGVKERGATVFIITHRVNVLALTDALLVLADGQLRLGGARDDVLQKLQQQKQEQQQLQQNQQSQKIQPTAG